MILSEGEEPHLTLGLDLEDGADVMRIADDLGGRAVEILADGVSLNAHRPRGGASSRRSPRASNRFVRD